METEPVLISDMWVDCSLMTHNFERGGMALSDCCGQRARSGVIMPNGDTHWRCIVHEGMVDFRTGAKGEIVFVVNTRV